MITTTTVDTKMELNPSYMALNWQDYLTLAQYMKQLEAYIKQANKVIDSYETRD